MAYYRHINPNTEEINNENNFKASENHINQSYCRDSAHDSQYNLITNNLFYFTKKSNRFKFQFSACPELFKLDKFTKLILSVKYY